MANAFCVQCKLLAAPRTDCKLSLWGNAQSKVSRPRNRTDSKLCWWRNAKTSVSRLWNPETRVTVPRLLLRAARDPHQCRIENPEFHEENLWKWSNSTNQLIAYGLLVAGIPLGSLLPDSLFSSTFYFFSLGLWVLYVGSHKSLDSKQTQTLSFQGVVVLPIILSLTLFGFYSLLRFFPDTDLKAFLSVYFSSVGVFAVARNASDLIAILFPISQAKLFELELPKEMSNDTEKSVKITSRFADIFAILVGILIMIAKNQSRSPFILNNIIATCIATEILSIVSLGSFLTASALLFGLLLYDVFWVFGSSHVIGENVMITVATSSAFDGPTKLIFPHHEGNSPLPYSLLGLGDIVIPGLFAAFMLRFDRSRFLEKVHGDGKHANQGPSCQPDKLYFITSLISYLLGLILTVVANVISGEGQPALLYLVPCQLGSIFFASFLMSDADLLFRYKEDIFKK
eukprot:TRINITY_DN7157_c0_g1_i2.p1 TRINITY_DN7157_c0_g1~~TRINITY_DN7157_c0_g1_i2.p1  ORF type:complete len:457 (+),score=48.27 TRINITY_DN7157_c0_g1_i2:78-1448(+)